MKHGDTKDLRKTKPIQPVQTSGGGRPKLSALDVLSFSILFAILALTIYLYVQWSIRPLYKVPTPDSILPPLSEAIQNFKLMFHGYKNGYLRTILGYIVFAVMSAFFLSIGKWVARRIFQTQGDTSWLQSTNSIERASLYYILGSLLASLLWLGLGMAGFLNESVAVAMGLIGCTLIIVQLYNRQLLVLVREKYLLWKRQFTLTEKSLSLALILGLLLCSSGAVQPQLYSDTYQIHLSLPNIYINEGRITTNPFFVYSYFTLNTEMLMMWAILMKTDLAAALLMWGFFVAFIGLAFGFLTKQANFLTGLLTAFLLATAPVILWFSISIKNDLPAALFLFAHYVGLFRGFNGLESDPKVSKRWILLSGIFCGGAVGHKLTALIPASITLALLLGWDLYSYIRKTKRPDLASFPWIIGFILAVFPWFLRTFLATGNPVYPYFNGFFGGHLIKPWHTAARVSTSIAVTGWEGLVGYFKMLIGTQVQNGSLLPPNWGPTALLVLSCFFALNRGAPIGLRFGLLAAVLSWVFHLCYALEPRYHIAFIAFTISMSFAFCFNVILTREKFQRIFKHFTVLVLLTSCAQTFSHSMEGVLPTSLKLLLSGVSPGNYNLAKHDEQVNDLRWMAHIMDTRTQRDETILYAGVTYGYGAHRKTFFGVDPDKQILQDLAEQSSDANDLCQKLRTMKVDHILFNPEFFEINKNNPDPQLRIHEGDLQKIKESVKTCMSLRLAAPSGKMIWYSLKDNDDGNERLVLLDSGDAREFPLMFLEYANMNLASGDLTQAQKMFETLLKVPMLSGSKAQVFRQLAIVHGLKGERSEVERCWMSAIEDLPKDPANYFNLAVWYDSISESEKSREQTKKALQLGGKSMLESEPKLARLKKYVNNVEAGGFNWGTRP